MRQIYILPVVVCAFLACQPAETPVTYLGGTLEEYQGQKVFLARSFDRIGYKDWTGMLDTAIVSEDGAFAFQWTADAAEYYQVIGEKGYPLFQEVLLDPGDSMLVHVPVQTDSTFTTYTGPRGGAYACQHRLDSLWRADPRISKRYYEIAEMDMDSARLALDYKYSQRMKIIDAHFQGHPEWAPIYQKFRDETAYRVGDERFGYLKFHNYFTQDTFLYLIPDEGYYDFVKVTNLDNPVSGYSYDFNTFLADYLADRVHRDHTELADSALYANMLPFMVDATKHYLSGRTADMAFLAIADQFSSFLGRENFFSELDSMEAYLSLHHTDPSVYRRFKHIKADFEQLKPGNQAPDLALPDASGDTIRLSDLRGTVIYLDFWGTWCFPCLQELPHSLTLQEKFKDDPVSFVYVGLESGEEQLTEWKAFIRGERSFDYAPFLEQRVYPGIHLLAEGQFGNPAIQPFRIGGAPTYVLIDAEGKIVKADAPRPSSDEIEGLIRSVLGEG